MAVGDETRT